MSNNENSNRWSERELVTFFYWFKEHGKNWKSIQENLKSVGFERPVQDIKEVFKRNKGYLGLPTAKAEDFVTIVNDYYKSIDDDSDNSIEENSEKYHTPKNNSVKDNDYAIEWNEEIADDASGKAELNILSSMARDNTRGPFGVDPNYEDSSSNL